MDGKAEIEREEFCALISSRPLFFSDRKWDMVSTSSLHDRLTTK
jgi:hypothetical protein